MPMHGRTKEIASLNTKIIELNLESPQSPLKTFGVRFGKVCNKDRLRNLMQLAMGHKHLHK